jgi:hypothetical protein
MVFISVVFISFFIICASKQRQKSSPRLPRNPCLVVVTIVTISNHSIDVGDGARDKRSKDDDSLLLMHDSAQWSAASLLLVTMTNRLGEGVH